MNNRSSEISNLSVDEWLFDNQISEFFTIGELANRLKLSVSGLRKIIARDAKFPKYKVGHQLRFNWKEVDRYFRKGE